jgi:hypothetical protein
MAHAKVVGRKHNGEGHLIGILNANPLLHTCIYEVSFLDGSMGEYAANIIAKNMYAQVYDEGRQFNNMKEIVDHRKDSGTISRDDGYVTHNGKRHPK